MIGKTLGHYQITSQLGKGGMGEVFQAKDQVLGRDVAIKILPEEFAKDAERVARFQREAKVLASLNHPNIAAIYGLEQSERKNFLVLELVDGETLADRIKAGPIPVEESLKLALQIAEALEAAHEKGVIHRDLKPANIKVTPDGKVKVLDFGLAKAYAGEKEQVNLSNSPTLSDAATQQGVILGTAAYMSPEQAKGKAVDKRADIWAFGVVLFEMLTGRQVFAGETVSDTLASVLAREPKWQSLPTNLHPRIRLLLERCLKKDPRDRYGSINDGRVDIQDAMADSGGVLVQPVTAVEPRTRLRAMLPWIAAAIVLTAVIVGLAVWKLNPPEPRRVVRLDHMLPDNQQFNIDSVYYGHTLAISADGGQFIYSTAKGLYLRHVESLEARRIPGTEKDNPQSPFFSPDGRWLGYWSQSGGQLKKIPVSGGTPVKLCDVSYLYGAVWQEDDTIVFSDITGGGIKRVSANGGTPERLVEGATSTLQLLPGGESIVYTDVSITPPYRIVARSLKTGDQKELLAGNFIKYVPTGHIVYGMRNNLYVVRFDPRTYEVIGGSDPVVENAQFAAISDSGTLIYVPWSSAGGNIPMSTLLWVDKQGHEEPLDAPPNKYDSPTISPDGKRVAFVIGELLREDIHIWDFARKNLVKLTLDETREIQPIWTPDGKSIIYFSTHEAAADGIYRRPADGSGAVERLSPKSDNGLYPFSLSSDGKSLFVMELVSMSNGDIAMLSMEGNHELHRLLQREYSEAQPRISPNGRWLAYVSSESTADAPTAEVYIRPYPEVDKGKEKVSTGSGNCPLWSPDGRELFYLSGDNFVMAVSVKTEPILSLGTPQRLFPNANLGLIFGRGYPWDISPDGKRFLMMKPAKTPDRESAAESPRKINVVLNWTEELKQRVPGK